MLYKFKGEQLYRLPLYIKELAKDEPATKSKYRKKLPVKKDKIKFTGRIWTVSDYSDISGNSSTWVPITEEIILKYKIEEKHLC